MSSTEPRRTPAADGRLRHVVAVLADAEESHLAFDTLVNAVLRREYRGDREPTGHRRAVANALHFEVLPRLQSRGLLRHDTGADVVRFDPEDAAVIRASADPGLDAGPAAARPPSPREVTAGRLS